MSPRNAIHISYTGKTPKSPYTFAEVEADFRVYERKWLRSIPYTTLRKQLSSSVAPLDINKIVAFGLGSLRCGEYASRSHTQHAALLTMASIIEKVTGQNVQCFTQDPAYNEVDQEFLRNQRITVLNDPHGFLKIDANTLVFSVCPNIPVKQVTVDMARPAIMIWDTVETLDEQREWRTEVFENGDICRVRSVTVGPTTPSVKVKVK
jgi:hypothetical protein